MVAMIDVIDAITDPKTKHILVAAISHNNNTIKSNAIEMKNDIYFIGKYHRFMTQ